MTGPFTVEHTAIVNEMVQRLRALQGIDEQVPLARRVIAGEGLQGGGTLENDVTLSLESSIKTAVETLIEVGGAENLVTAEMLQSAMETAVEGYARAEDIRKPVVTHDFTVMEAPVGPVTAPPVVVNSEAKVTKMGVTCISAGSQPVTVTLDDTPYVMEAGQVKQAFTPDVTKQAGEFLNLVVGSTDASGILVTLRLEEV